MSDRIVIRWRVLWRVVARYPRKGRAPRRKSYSFPTRELARRWVRFMRSEVPMLALGPIRRVSLRGRA